LLLKEEREQVIEYGKKLIEEELTEGTGGNITIHNPEKDLIAISPTGMDYFEIYPEDVVIVNEQGEVVEGSRKPSSELGMHTILHRKREDVEAVVHTHSMYATSISTLRREIPAAHYLTAFGGKKIPCADYETFGTEELAKSAYKTMGTEYNVILLANHGLLAVGEDIETAFSRAQMIEYVAEVYYRAKCIGEPTILPDEEMELMLEKFKTYGQGNS